jgi:protein tyrosine phosphatase (PTP) superfamily phosphohydrolase (DUF442 family)
MTAEQDILNWRRWDTRISLSGQPTEGQLSTLAQSGVVQIINLGPHSNDGALDDEAASVAQLGMEYVYIPVDFSNPTEADWTVFCAAIDAAPDAPLHVHCIYKLMDGIWRPGGVWARFIGKPEDADKPNRYLGYDYN